MKKIQCKKSLVTCNVISCTSESDPINRSTGNKEELFYFNQRSSFCQTNTISQKFNVHFVGTTVNCLNLLPLPHKIISDVQPTFIHIIQIY